MVSPQRNDSRNQLENRGPVHVVGSSSKDLPYRGATGPDTSMSPHGSPSTPVEHKSKVKSPPQSPLIDFDHEYDIASFLSINVVQSAYHPVWRSSISDSDKESSRRSLELLEKGNVDS